MPTRAALHELLRVGQAYYPKVTACPEGWQFILAVRRGTR